MVDPVDVACDRAEWDADGPSLAGLLPALRWLDRLLVRAIAAAQVAYGPDAAIDRYRGLYISQDEAERLLAREPGTPALMLDPASVTEGAPDAAGPDSRLA